MPSKNSVRASIAACTGWLAGIASVGGCFQDPLTVVEVNSDTGDDDGSSDADTGDDDGATSVPTPGDGDDDGEADDGTDTAPGDSDPDDESDDGVVDAGDEPQPDCAGVPGGDAVLDECGVCDGDGSSCADCAGVPNGDATEDVCGVCEGDGSSCTDCAGVPNGGADLDECGVCEGPGGPCWGCTTEAASNYDPFAEIDDGSCTCEPGPAQIVDQAQSTSNAGSGGETQWQSFTPAISGGLSRIEIGVGSPVDGASPATIDFFLGEGEDGPLLGSLEVTLQPVLNQMQGFDLPAPIPMDAREVYTYRLTVPQVAFGFVDVHTGDPYTTGRASFSPDYDLEFRTHVTACE
jgi:hypothetical protein